MRRYRAYSVMRKKITKFYAVSMNVIKVSNKKKLY